MADEYNVVGFNKICEDYIATGMNCAQMIRLASLYNDKHVMATAVEVFKERKDAVMTSQGWRKLERDHPSIVFRFLSKVLSQFL